MVNGHVRYLSVTILIFIVPSFSSCDASDDYRAIFLASLGILKKILWCSANVIETLSKVSVMTHVTDIFVNFDPQVDFNINGEGAMTILITILSNSAPGKRIL